jgi:hypothetical protein
LFDVVPAEVGHGVEAQTLLHLVPGLRAARMSWKSNPGRQGADDESFLVSRKLAATAPPTFSLQVPYAPASLPARQLTRTA